MSVQYLCNVCTVCVQYLYSDCTASVSECINVCEISAQCLHIVCTMSAQYLCSVCTVSAQCLYNISTMSAQWLSDVSEMSVQCPCNACTEFVKRVTMSVEVLCTVCTMPLHCLRHAAQCVHSDCTVFVQCAVFAQCLHGVCTILCRVWTASVPWFCSVCTVSVQCDCLRTLSVRCLQDAETSERTLNTFDSSDKQKQWENIIESFNKPATRPRQSSKADFILLISWFGSARSAQNHKGTPYKK